MRTTHWTWRTYKPGEVWRRVQHLHTVSLKNGKFHLRQPTSPHYICGGKAKYDGCEIDRNRDMLRLVNDKHLCNKCRAVLLHRTSQVLALLAGD
jgi:hypothetical protein